VAWHLQHGPNYKNGPCNGAKNVVDYLAVVEPAIPQAQPVNAAVTVGVTKMATLQRVATKGWANKYYVFGVPGVRGQVYITQKLVQGPCPDSIDVLGMDFVEPQPEAADKTAEAEAKAEERAKAAQAKVAKAEERAKAAQAKVVQAAEKAKARADAAVAKASKATASAQPDL
jgi:hypothetical protein